MLRLLPETNATWRLPTSLGTAKERRSARVQVLNPNGAAGKILKRRMLSFPDVFEKAIGSWIGRVPK